MATVWYQSLVKEVLFVKVTGRNVFENAAQEREAITWSGRQGCPEKRQATRESSREC